MMDRISRLRVAAFAVGLLALACLIAWATHASWQELDALRNSLSRGQISSFEIADHLQASIITLNTCLIRYQLEGDAAQLEEYEKASRRLNEWIDEKKPDLDSPRERALLNLIDTSYDTFLTTARAAIQARSTNAPAATLEAMIRVNRSATAMLELGSHLGDAHRNTLEQLLASHQKSATRVQWSIFGGLMLLVALGFLLARFVYRDLISPLQSKLVESHAIIEHQEKLASLGVLAAGVAHEIRTPLTAIKARLYRQQQALDEASTPYEDSTVIGREIVRLERIVKEVLHFARPPEPDLVSLPVARVFQEITDLMSAAFEKRGVALKVEPPGDLTVLADRDQLKQVLINLVQNGAESIDGHGTVTLRAARRTLTRVAGGAPGVGIEVEDSGRGITPEVEKRLFDPFFTTKGGGTGLGLAIAARIVGMHRGDLEYRTAIQRGTAFTVILPAPAAS